MAAELGYAGKMLKVDLYSAHISHVPTSDYADRFIGGRGMPLRSIGMRSRRRQRPLTRRTESCS